MWKMPRAIVPISLYNLQAIVVSIKMIKRLQINKKERKSHWNRNEVNRKKTISGKTETQILLHRVICFILYYHFLFYVRFDTDVLLDSRSRVQCCAWSKQRSIDTGIDKIYSTTGNKSTPSNWKASMIFSFFILLCFLVTRTPCYWNWLNLSCI